MARKTNFSMPGKWTVILVVALGAIGIWALLPKRGSSTGGTSTARQVVDEISCSKPRCLVYDGQLADDWSRKVTIMAGYDPEVRVIDEGAVAQVQANDDDDLVYTKDTKNVIRVEGVIIDDFTSYTGATMNSIRVRAAPGSNGKRVTVSVVAKK